MDQPAESKRAKISKAQRLTLLEVLIASLILGSCLVVINNLFQYIGFNMKVIEAKNTAINQYDQTIRSAGVCNDSDNNGRLNDVEIENCKPNELALSAVKNSLRYSIYETMSENANLESVARKRNENGICFTSEGKVRDFVIEYDRAKTLAEREQALQGMRLCSALRVIPDALPAQKNTEALMASLNQLFLVAGITPDSMMPMDDRITSKIPGVEVIPVSFRMSGTGPEVITLLDTIEDSIREFDIVSATIEWTNDGLTLRSTAYAYYLGSISEVETGMKITPAHKKGATASGSAESAKKKMKGEDKKSSSKEKE